jgi:DNA-binding NarL/FixJ family response regulator
LETLDRLLEEACTGTSRFVLLTGEPGIGKTCLLTELLRRADRRGCLTLAGRAAEFERELPFGLLVDAFDEYLEGLDSRALERLTGDGARELGDVFPSLSTLASGSGERSGSAERFRAHHAARELIERLAARQPLVLGLDDLHWADSASLELVTHLLRRPPRAPVLVVAAYRTGQVEPRFAGAVETATRERALEHVELRPLGSAGIGALLGGGDAGRRERLFEQSGGNPFYAIHLARMPAPARDDAASEGDVPAAIMAAIASELADIPDSARTLAHAASVAGDPFELDLAIEAAALNDADALGALDELVERSLVRPSRVPRRFNFRHPLVRRAIYESCPPGARLVAHRRTAEALAARGAPASSRAHHVEHSARHGDADAIAILRQAGLDSSQRAPASAERWFEAALRILPEEAPEENRVELLVALARAQAARGRFEASRSALLRSIELMPHNAPVARVRLIGECARVEQLLGHHDQARRRLLDALAQQGEDHSPQAAELLIGLAVDTFYRMDYELMRSWSVQALSVARQLEDAPLIAAACAVVALADAFGGAIEEAESHRAEAAALVDALPDDELSLRLDAAAHLGGAELYLDRYQQAEAHLKRGVALARTTEQGHLFPVFVPALAASLFRRGRLAESAALLDGAIDGARLAGDVQALAWNLLDRAFTALLAGDLETAHRAAEESAELTAHLDDSLVSANAGAVHGDIMMESGDPARAVELLLASAGGEQLPLIPGALRVYYLELLTRCWLALEREAEAERAATRAEDMARELRLPLAAALARRAAGAVALAAGNPTAAAEHARASVACADGIGARIEAALSRTLAGRALAQAGNNDRAVTELEQAATELHMCGALRHRDRAERELGKLGRRTHRRTRPGTGSGVDSLTERELEVARLVVDRRTNPEIASALFLSVKTVEGHMRNIFRKLDVSSRVEVARIAERAEA